MDRLSLIDRGLFDTFLSTFKFTESKAEIPKPISDLFTQVNKRLSLNIIPTIENKFETPTGIINKKSWKLDLSNLKTSGLISVLTSSLKTNNENADGGFGATMGYENTQMKCFYSYSCRSPDPINCTDEFKALTCTEQ
jgi:hypothetical protein